MKTKFQSFYLEQFLAPMLGVAMSLVFINFPLKRKTERTEVPWYDWLAATVSLITGIYASIVFPDLQDRLSENPLDALIISVIFVLSIRSTCKSILVKSMVF